MEIEINKRQISAEEFINLRQSVGWGYPDDREAISTGLKNSILSICIEIKGELVGYGRIIGDGGFTFYIQDVIVCPSYQRRGIGTKIMEQLMKHISISYPKGSMICLMSARGKEGFYKKFGFIERPNEMQGSGMTMFLKN